MSMGYAERLAIRAVVRGLVKAGALKAAGVATIVGELKTAAIEVIEKTGNVDDAEGIRGLAGDLENDAVGAANRRS